MVTIFDVAREAGVSVVTVSRLMNTPQIVSSRTADKIVSVMERLNYQPSQLARSLVGKRTNMIGVIVPDIRDSFFNSWFRRIEEFATARSINLLLCNTDESAAKELQCIKLLQSQRVDGVVIAPHSRTSVEYLMNINISFMLFDRYFKDMETNVVASDHYDGAYKATEYLIRLGHRRIAIVKGPGMISVDRERYFGYRDAMKKHRIAIEADDVRNGGLSEHEACAAMIEMMKKKSRPTAVFSITGVMTEGVIRGARMMNVSIPDDVSLVSFDAISGQALVLPTITHVVQPVKQLGKDVIAGLLKMINEKKHAPPRRIIVKPKLVIGDSCRRLSS
ncbi:MAG TPA: LacI family DNA-binding transcriptional regulator [Bacteroidota bacterium]|nr:LacI family DNA-binding transcriptional regulator [Bacteroidota bacterium]